MLIAPNIGRSSKHKFAKVNSRLKNLIANFGCQFFVVYTALGAFGFTLLGGTYFTAVLYKDFAVVAIDSRASDINGVTPPDDRYCKITPISDELIFFATGFVHAKNLFAEDIFDAGQNGRLAFDNTADHGNLDEMIHHWDEYMRRSYSLAFVINPNWKSKLVGKMIVKGFFAGIDKTQTMVISEADISSNLTGEPYTQFSEARVQTAEAGRFVHGGHYETITELYDNGRTQRARDVLSEIASKTSGLPVMEAMAIRAQTFVRFVRDFGNDSGIGGDIGVVILEGGKKWRWYHRPDFCPEN
jgi:hypothetical protein